MGDTYSMHGWGEKCILIGKPQGKRALGWPMRRWKDNIKMFLTETGRGIVEYILLALINALMNIRIPQMSPNKILMQIWNGFSYIVCAPSMISVEWIETLDTFKT